MRMPLPTISAAVIVLLLAIGMQAAPQTSTKGKTASKAKTSNSGALRTPKEEFGNTGKSGKNYESAGRAAAGGGKSLGAKTADGDIVGGAGDFGKGMGKMGKEVGVGTAKAGASVGRGVASVFSGGGKKHAKTPRKSTTTRK